MREALEAIHARHGKLTPELVVAEARVNRSNVGKFLHGRFEWNDKEAAEKWRLTQAAELIRSVRVVYREATEEEEARDVRAFHAVRRADGNVYEPLEKIVEDPITTKILLRDAEREWKAMHRRYAHLVEFVEMVRGDIEKAA